MPASGAQSRNRTSDTGIFSPLLYQLSYLGKSFPRRTAREGNCNPKGTHEMELHLVGDGDPEVMLRKVLSDFEIDVLERSPIEYRCYCSRERMERALISMGPGELQALIDDQGEAELTCRFCDNVQHFTRQQLEALLESMRKK